MKWKSLLHKQNARHFAWPAGWDPAEVIAEQLECSPERVREHLAPSIRAGEVEVKQFTIWDSETGRKVIKTGFRIGGKSENRQKSVDPATKRNNPRPERWPFYEGAAIVRCDAPNRIGKVVGGEIHWSDGRVAIPSRSTAHKLRLKK
jgi:hypothetical protein